MKIRELLNTLESTSAGGSGLGAFGFYKAYEITNEITSSHPTHLYNIAVGLAITSAVLFSDNILRRKTGQGLFELVYSKLNTGYERAREYIVKAIPGVGIGEVNLTD